MTTRTDLAAQLAKIGLLALGASLDDFLARTTKGRWSPVQMLEEIARLEQAEKTRRSLQSRLQRARIGRFKPLADFDWNWPKKSAISSSAPSPSSSSGTGAASSSSDPTASARP